MELKAKAVANKAKSDAKRKHEEDKINALLSDWEQAVEADWHGVTNLRGKLRTLTITDEDITVTRDSVITTTQKLDEFPIESHAD